MPGYLEDSGFGRDSLANAITRINAIETGKRVVAYLKGNLTGGGLSSSFTIMEADNLTIVSLGANAINFQFTVDRPNTTYAAYLVNTSGTGALEGSSPVLETNSTFSINTVTNGALIDPRALAVEFAVTVIHNGV